jgi:hypothetical protein
MTSNAFLQTPESLESPFCLLEFYTNTPYLQTFSFGIVIYEYSTKSVLLAWHNVVALVIAF